MSDPKPPPSEHPPETVRLTDKTLEHLENLMASSVRRAIRESLTEDTAELFWGAGLKVLQRQATDHAGRFVLGGLWGLVRRAGMFLTLGGIVYAIGGWSALAGLAKTLFSQGSTP